MTGHNTGIRARLWVLALTLLLTGMSVGIARAEPPETERQARRLFESAEAHFRGGLFAEALAEYQAGYEIHPLPGFLINIAQCQRRLGNLSVAQATYRKFIMVAPDSPFVPQVKALIAELENLNQNLAGTSSEARPEAAAAKAGEEPKPAERESPNPSPAPSTTSTALTLVSPPPVAQPQSKTRWWLWGAIGAAAVGAITAVVLVSLPPGNKTLHDGSLGTLRR
jgi:hypothetical protein